MQVVDCCHDSSREEWTGQGSRERVASKGSCEETLVSLITLYPDFSDLNKQLHL